MSTTPSRLRKPSTTKPVRVTPNSGRLNDSMFAVPSTPVSLLRRPNSAPPDESAMTTPKNRGNFPSHEQQTRSVSADDKRAGQRMRPPPAPGTHQRRKSYSTPQNTMGGREERPSAPLHRRAPPSPVVTPLSEPKNEDITIRVRNQKMLVPSPRPQIKQKEKSQESGPATQPAAVASKSEADFWKEKFEKARAERIVLEGAVDARRRGLYGEKLLIRRAMILKRLDDQIDEKRAAIEHLVTLRQNYPCANTESHRRAIRRFEENVASVQKEMSETEDKFKKEPLMMADGSSAAWSTAVRPEREQSEQNSLHLL